MEIGGSNPLGVAIPRYFTITRPLVAGFVGFGAPMDSPNAPDTDERRELLLEEYRITVDLSKHDDTLRQQRIANFLTVNTVLVAVVGVGLSTEPADAVAIVLLAVIAAFGVAVASVWAIVQLRNTEYIRLRRHQLRQLEAELGVVSTFTVAHKVLNEHERHDFGADVGPWEVGRFGRGSSTTFENALPVIVLLFWLVAGVALEIAITMD